MDVYVQFLTDNCYGKTRTLSHTIFIQNDEMQVQFPPFSVISSWQKLDSSLHHFVVS